MRDKLPATVRYVKNGGGARWWPAAKTNQQIHLGWSGIPRELLMKPDFAEIKRLTKAQHGPKPGAMQDFNQLHDLLSAPSQHIWMTFGDGHMWWCTVLDGATVNPNGESSDKGNFWLVCDRPWSKQSLKGRLLAKADLPGTVTTVAGFKGQSAHRRLGGRSSALFKMKEILTRHWLLLPAGSTKRQWKR